MSYYILDLKVAPRLSAPNERSLKRNAAAIGLKHASGHDATSAAEKLSALPSVLHVTLTLINETSIGVWRKGKRT